MKLIKVILSCLQSDTPRLLPNSIPTAQVCDATDAS